VAVNPGITSVICTQPLTNLAAPMLQSQPVRTTSTAAVTIRQSELNAVRASVRLRLSDSLRKGLAKNVATLIRSALGDYCGVTQQAVLQHHLQPLCFRHHHLRHQWLPPLSLLPPWKHSRSSLATQKSQSADGTMRDKMASVGWQTTFSLTTFAALQFNNPLRTFHLGFIRLPAVTPQAGMLRRSSTSNG